jgi:hypothetical protein
MAGKFGEAEVECRMALAMFQALYDESPDNAIVRDGVASSLIYLNDAVRSAGRSAEAKSGYERAIVLWEAAVQENPAGAWHRYMLAGTIRRRGLILSELGDAAGAAVAARRALLLCDGRGPRSVEHLFETACCHAMMAGLAGRAGSGVSEAEGEKEAGRSMEWLRRAAAIGYRNVHSYRTADVLDPLRSRDDFKLLMMDLAMPGDPFTSAR